MSTTTSQHLTKSRQWCVYRWRGHGLIATTPAIRSSSSSSSEAETRKFQTLPCKRTPKTAYYRPSARVTDDGLVTIPSFSSSVSAFLHKLNEPVTRHHRVASVMSLPLFETYATVLCVYGAKLGTPKRMVAAKFTRRELHHRHSAATDGVVKFVGERLTRWPMSRRGVCARCAGESTNTHENGRLSVEDRLSEVERASCIVTVNKKPIFRIKQFSLAFAHSNL